MLMALERSVIWHRVIPLNPAYLEGGTVAQPRAVAASFVSALAQAPYPDVSEGIAALSGYHALSAVVDIPTSREFVPRQIIPREARRLFSYGPESSMLDWVAIKGPGDGQRRYLLTVTRRAAIQALKDVFAAAGVRLRALDSGPLAVARAANIRDGVVVQAESDGGDVVILKNGTVGLVRSAYWGGDIIDQESLLARVVDLVERSVLSHNDANPAGPLDVEAPVLLAGAGASVLGNRVAEAMSRPAGAFAPPLEIVDPVPVSDVAANLGMVLRGVR